jgi:hypothetical protein
MALLFMDGFDHYDAVTHLMKKWTSSDYYGYVPPSSVYSSTGGRRGGGTLEVRGFQESPKYNLSYLKTLPSSYQTLIFGAAVKFSHGSATGSQPFHFMAFVNGSTYHVCLRLNLSTRYLELMRYTSLLGTYSVAISDGVWYYIEVKTTISNSVGTAELRVNEFPALVLTGIDTCNGGDELVNSVAIGGFYSSGTLYQYVKFDDLYVCDTSGSMNNDFLGDCRIDTIVPSGAGYTTNWTPSAGSNYQCVDDAQFDNGSDYVSETTVDDIDSYAFGDLPVGIVDIKGIQTNLFGKRADSAVLTKAKPTIRPVATTHLGAEVTFDDNYYDLLGITELNPETSTAWTKTTLDATEFGVKLTVNPL